VNLRSGLILTFIISILISCTKIENTEIGAGLIPPVDNINTFDISLNTVTENLLDTGAVFPFRTDNLALGRISNDPLFGKTTGIVSLEMKPEYFSFRFPGLYDSLKLDSVVFVLSYKGVWGDSNQTQTLRLHELTSSLKGDTVYSTRYKPTYGPTVIGSATVDVRNLLADTLKPYGEVVKKDQIRIRITDPSVQQRLFYDTALLDSNTAFRDRFKGFAVVPDTGSLTANSLLLVNLADTNTKVAFYYTYRLATGTKRETGVTYFRYQPASALIVNGFANTIIRNPVGAKYQQNFASGPDSLLYLQTKPDAPYTTIKIPGLDTLSNCIIHRAELQVVQVPNTATGNMDDYFSAPALFLSAYSTDSARRFVIPGGDVDFSLAGINNLGTFGGDPFNRVINGKPVVNYAFNITRYVQAIATRKTRNYSFVLSAPYADYVYASENYNALVPIAGSGVLNAVAIGRVRVGGGNHPNAEYRMRLRIIYTRI
jgi:hypothetical protein